jgi:carbon monoxide dehydrogenase subunit G
MDLVQTRRIAAPPETVWQALVDPVTLQACIPGCEAFEATGDNEYRTTLLARVGPVSARFTGRMQLVDVQPPHRYTLRFEGQGGAAGFARGSADVALTPAEGGVASDLSYTVKAQVGGKLAQIGNRLIDGAAQKLADDFFARFSRTVEAAAQPSGPPAAGEATTAPAENEAPPTRIWIRYATAAVLAAIVLYLASKGR